MCDVDGLSSKASGMLGSAEVSNSPPAGSALRTYVCLFVLRVTKTERHKHMNSGVPRIGIVL